MKNNKRRKILLVILFVVGMSIFLYPFISQQFYKIEANNQIEDFESLRSQMPTAEVKEKIDLAKAYNRTLDPAKLADPYTDKEKKGVAEYARMLELHEKIGYVEIPQIEENLPIYAGTSEEVLQKGTGHLEGTSLPIGGNSTHTVITAHRGLPTAKLFRELDNLKNGDIFYIHNIEGVLAYEVDQKLTVDPSNFEPVLVQENKDYATLLTCTPYMINSHRLLVRGHRVKYVAPIKEQNLKINADMKYKDYISILIPILLIIFFIFVLNIYDYGKLKRRIKKVEEQIKDKE